MYPWLETCYAGICEGVERLPPALMFVGSAGLGKLELAFATAAALRCQDRQGGAPCGACASCKDIERGSEPDLHLVTTEQLALDLPEARARLAARYLENGDGSKGRKPRQVISVGQVRQLIENLSTHAHGRDPRIAIIAPAAAMNINAANALLKILEEPPGDTRFLLVCTSRDAVPATIVSRVSVIECRPPAVERASAWLESQGVPATIAGELLALSSGAPLAALGMFTEGFIEHAGRWRRDLARLTGGEIMPTTLAEGVGADAGRFLFWLEMLLTDALMTRQGLGSRAPLLDEAGADGVLTSRLISLPLWDIIEKLQYYRCRQRPVIDEQLFLEDVLIAVWQKD